MNNRNNSIVAALITFFVAITATGCGTAPTYKWTEPTPSTLPQPITVYESAPGSLDYVPCIIEKVGSIRNHKNIKSSALIRGTCNANGRATDTIKGFWCVSDTCAGSDTRDISKVPGKIIGTATQGKVSGATILVTNIGAFYGNVSSNGDYDSGYLKTRRDGSGFLGKFNPDGSLFRGVIIRRNGTGGHSLIYAETLKNNKPVGFAYELTGEKYQSLVCDERSGCKVYVRNKAKDQIHAVLNILQSALLESLLFENPIKKVVFSIVQRSDTARDIERAYDLFGQAKTLQEMYGAIK